SGRLRIVPISRSDARAREKQVADLVLADVAAVLAECLREPRTAGAQFEVIAGDLPVAEAIARYVEGAGASAT
ncbi:MAG: hypothetical protein M3320_04335, partial [Actinomycetota bacterium]|nr:hypothetical protein [Actinomycetota bacterium]